MGPRGHSLPFTLSGERKWPRQLSKHRGAARGVMTKEETEGFFRVWRTAWASRDLQVMGSLYADNCVLESPAFGRLVGPAAIRKAFGDWWATFPDASVEFGDFVIIGEDRIAQTITTLGTDTGGFLGQGPTGRPFRVFIVLLFELQDQQIVHERRVYDVNGLLLQLASETAVAAGAVDLYRATLARARSEHELNVAAGIQRALLPDRQYQGRAFDLAGDSRPCRAIGGDFLDHFELSLDSFGFVLGDVAGKGPPAALLAAKLQGMMAAYASSIGAPAATVTRVNQELVRRTIESRFVTLFYGVLATDGRLTYCNGGHNPPFIIGINGVRRLGTGGLIVGAFKDAIFEEGTVTLDPGDVLLVFSDGVTEALSADDTEFGDDRLLECVYKNQETTANALLDSLFDAIREFSEGAEQSDDVTALILRYSGCSAPAS
jgi:serine phosphatase RsbU (regulator of sigma subunit)